MNEGGLMKRSGFLVARLGEVKWGLEERTVGIEVNDRAERRKE